MLQECGGALFADSNTDSFLCSIAPFEEDWHPSQGQQEVLLAEVALVVDGSVADEAIVGIDIALVSSFSSQSRFFAQFSSGSVISNSCDTPSFSVLKLQIECTLKYKHYTLLLFMDTEIVDME